MHGFDLAFASPRKLPRARDLRGNVAVLDIAFASEAGGKSFETVTLPLIQELGPRLAAWVDHHDSAHHARFAGDPRFVLSTKAEHGACPEMITPEVVARAGRVDTLVCHVDFDGLASGAKWMRGGVEPYPGCDDDARAIDTRIGVPGPVATRMDRALRARPRDQALFGLIVRHLASGLSDPSLWAPIDAAGAELAVMEAETRRIALRYERVEPGVVLVDASQRGGPYDKTLLLLIGQERAPISVVVDNDSVTFAARFDSGVNFLETFKISGGMPTRISLQRSKLKEALVALGVKPADAGRLAAAP
ncbi:hypothetical protein BE04_22355 [Sorangium cellulosum]|uniref:Uncharacterized protein n=2 Tax=Sorangium cellulosum TaxID=56 RepID=A0A150P1B3_SORCE|nr:hypothetical protein [Sorangium cellulosum]AGP34384.1 hypothetical protein SCE1572_07620 [Sorangium cellulosum So0157-2]KYF48856.1 hypothetical protein BE04_22355 [Sorangium cellulosum]